MVVTRLSPDLIDQLEIADAISDELIQMPDLLPQQIVDLALSAADTEVVTEYIRQLAAAGTAVRPSPQVVALKWRHGRRSVTALPFFERALYRAVVYSIRNDLVERVRGPESFSQFQNAPLQHQGTEYVVMTDLANYYETLDLDRLSQEILRRSGQWEQVEWLHHFWSETSGALGGIPQMNSTSDWIGDTYADQLHRELLRRGLAVWRHADDFRIACADYGACVEALELFDEKARALGLLVNERKTLTPSIAKYREIVEAPQRRLREINQQVQSDLTQFDPYDWSLVTPEEAEVLQESAIRVIGTWLPEADPSTDANPIDLVQVLPQTLIVLGVQGLTSALEKVPALLRWEPQLTPVIARYLRMLMIQDGAAVLRTVHECIQNVTLTKWQRLWLLNVMEESYASLYPWDDYYPALRDWMHAEVREDLEPLRCQAAWALALNRELALPEWEQLSTSSSGYSEPFATACLPGVVGLSDEAKRKLRPVGPIEQAVEEWSISTHFALPS